MSSSALALMLFGPFEARFNGRPFSAFATDKIRALLAYLAIESGQPHRRDTLAALLWPDCPDDIARRNLRQSLYRLRQAFQEVDPTLSDRLITQTRQTVTLNPEALTLDTARFHECLREARNSSEPFLQYNEILRLYRGELLKGFFISDAYAFEEWLTIQREMFHQKALDALVRLVALHEARDDPDAVLEAAHHVLMLEPWHERTYGQIMRAHLRKGNRAEAAAQYHRLKELLQRELGVEPAYAATVLYEQIQEGAVAVTETDAARRPTQLHHFPRALTPFVGRETELEYLVQTLQSPACRLCTIVGAGGMGKTRLALESARRLAAQSDRFRHGCFFVSLMQLDKHDLLISAVTQSLGLALPASADPRRSVIDFLQDRHLLLILDNFEHFLGPKGEPSLPLALDFLGEILTAAPDVVLLVTSREPLALQGEWVYPLEGLSYTNGRDNPQSHLDSAAPQLFIQCAQRYEPSFDAETQAGDILEICRVTGGLPLALEIAAAWARSYDCQDIAQRISGNLDFLTNPYRDAPARQRSIRAIFSYTWERLHPSQQRVLAALATFRGGFTMPAAIVVAEASVLDLAVLVEKSLLRRSGGKRYNLHELVRQFAAEKLAESGRQADVQDCHTGYYLSLLSEQLAHLNGPNPQDTLALIRQELDNIRAAWPRAIDRLQIDLIKEALDSLAQFLVLTGANREGEELLTQALASLQQHTAGKPGTVPLLSLLASNLAWLQIGLGKNQAAAENLHQAIAWAEQAGDARSRAYALSVLGWELQSVGNYDEAEAALSEALIWFQQADNPLQVSLALIRLGSLYWRKRDLERALDHYQQSLVIEQRLQNKRGINRATGGIGLAYQWLDKYDEAVEWLKKALLLDREMDNPLGVIRNLGNLGSVYFVTGQYDRALQCYQEAAQLEQETHYKSTLGVWLGAIGSIYKQKGEYKRALDYYDRAITLNQAVGDRFNLCANLIGKGELFLLRGEYAGAKHLLEQGKQLAGEAKRQESRLQACLLLARHQALTGQTETARQQLEEMLVDGKDRRREELARIYYELWQIERRADYGREALAAYVAASVRAEKAEYRERIEELELSLK
jgi:DNA-binding SARP family transcriptional activator/predicted ATPase